MRSNRDTMEVSRDKCFFYLPTQPRYSVKSASLDRNRQSRIAGLCYRWEMSITLMSRVWGNTNTKGSERLVLLALADMANDDGFCWPGFDHLARKCNLSKRFVIRLIGELENKGLIRKDHRFDDRGDQTSNMYRVLVGVNLSSPHPSEPQFTTVVNQSSPKSSINHSASEPKNNVSASASQPRLTDAEAMLKLHPAIRAFIQVTGDYPRKNLHRRIINVMGDIPDMARLQLTFDTWVANGYNPRHIKGWLFDWYKEGMHYLLPAQKLAETA